MRSAAARQIVLALHGKDSRAVARRPLDDKLALERGGLRLLENLAHVCDAPAAREHLRCARAGRRRRDAAERPAHDVAGPRRSSTHRGPRDEVESAGIERRARQGGGGLRQSPRDEPLRHAARDGRGADLSSLRASAAMPTARLRV